ncbi:GNAT family N-acetyltransferase [Nocardioides sp. Kera G14]|uniref:GNAT family N-acetyltransferase n=1 Tax=Nocardioides sp. Kera G14 TaxID=2884264 RepID=UPI001D105773|nr:GNAT family N-acetyltransferase [Nocardioides sp. Kera G14]UDY24524.1 GNAT family N-acetyltransferase [Nocardioides sp. Kera G14]
MRTGFSVGQDDHREHPTGDADDVDAILEVGRTAWHATYVPLAGEDYVREGLAQWWTVESTLRAIEGNRILVAEVGDRVVGMTGFGRDGDALVVWRLYLLPEAQRRGLGRALLEAAIESHRGDVTAVRLAHMAGNDNARAFYDRMGFVETHRESSSLGGPDDVWMRLDLSRSLD